MSRFASVCCLFPCRKVTSSSLPRQPSSRPPPPPIATNSLPLQPQKFLSPQPIFPCRGKPRPLPPLPIIPLPRHPNRSHLPWLHRCRSRPIHLPPLPLACHDNHKTDRSPCRRCHRLPRFLPCVTTGDLGLDAVDRLISVREVKGSASGCDT